MELAWILESDKKHWFYWKEHEKSYKMNVKSLKSDKYWSCTGEQICESPRGFELDFSVLHFKAKDQPLWKMRSNPKAIWNPGMRIFASRIHEKSIMDLLTDKVYLKSLNNIILNEKPF